MNYIKTYLLILWNKVEGPVLSTGVFVLRGGWFPLTEYLLGNEKLHSHPTSDWFWMIPLACVMGWGLSYMAQGLIWFIKECVVHVIDFFKSIDTETKRQLSPTPRKQMAKRVRRTKKSPVRVEKSEQSVLDKSRLEEVA